ncbi:MAG: M48 family metallopeptidase [Elusimicrobia bacterium]|nr:M48 family metallopeptidase [Elusimicrobiota bacterium]
MNIYEQQEKNKRLTIFIFAVFFVFFILIGLGFDYFYLGTVSGAKPKYKWNENGYYEVSGTSSQFFPLGTILASGFALVMSFSGALSGHKMVLRSAMARRAVELSPKEKQFVNIVKEMSIASGLPQPQAYIVPDSDLNAFATGFSPENSYIAVTEGLLEKLNREELQAVVAHEMSHIRNYDIRVMTVAAALVNAVSLISDWSVRSARYSSGRGYSSSSSRSGRGGGGILILVWLIFVLVAPIISRILALAISRQREYLADASAAELTRNPLALVSALEKIRMSVEPTYAVNNGIAHMCITDPRGSLIEEREGLVGDLFATHPPMEKRILALKLMAYQMSGQTRSQSLGGIA